MVPSTIYFDDEIGLRIKEVYAGHESRFIAYNALTGGKRNPVATKQLKELRLQGTLGGRSVAAFNCCLNDVGTAE